MNELISLVIPLYNEETCLEVNVTEILDYLGSIQNAYELILVNDGSKDATEAICKSLVNSNKHTYFATYSLNQGKGHAVNTGILMAKGQYRLFMDVDLAVPLHYLGRAINRLREGADVVIGSRHLPESSFIVREGPFRQFLGEVYRRFFRFVMGLHVTDITCGLKGFNHKVALDIISRSRIRRWGWDAEIIFLIQKLGYSIHEIPVSWHHSPNSKVEIFSDSIRTFIEMIQIYRNYYTGKYHISR